MGEETYMDNLKITKNMGKDLPQDMIDFMVKNRVREYGKNIKDFEKDEKDSIFFFLKDGEKIKSFGMLKPLTLFCNHKSYQIMGIGNIIAIEKRKGYGTILMNYIKDYLEKNNYIGMGNSHSDNSNFYEKCGFTFVYNFLERFIYVNNKGKEQRCDWSGHDMFVFDKKNELNKLINKNNNIIIKIPFR